MRFFTITTLLLLQHFSLANLPFDKNYVVEREVREDEFGLKELAIMDAAEALQIDESILLDIIYIECRGNFKAQAKSTKAYGCIQFMPSTLNRLGTSTEEFKRLEDYEQLPYVEEYFRRWKCIGEDLYTMYFCVFFPAARSKPNDWVLRSKKLSAESVAKANKGFDINKDGVLTVGEIKTKIDRIVKKRE